MLKYVPLEVPAVIEQSSDTKQAVPMWARGDGGVEQNQSVYLKERKKKSVLLVVGVLTGRVGGE